MTELNNAEVTEANIYLTFRINDVLRTPNNFFETSLTYVPSLSSWYIYVNVSGHINHDVTLRLLELNNIEYLREIADDLIAKIREFFKEPAND